jgi:hypothetical protein
MSIQVKRRREAMSFLSSYIGAPGELLVDTTNNRILVQDGATAGGWPVAKLGEAVAPSPNGATAQRTWIEQDVTLSGASVTFTLSLPSYSCILYGIACRVTTAIGGATSFEIGSTAGGSQFASGIGVAVGSMANGNGPVGYYGSGQTLYITPVGGAANFSAGAVRLSALIETVYPPAS